MYTSESNKDKDHEQHVTVKNLEAAQACSPKDPNIADLAFMACEHAAKTHGAHTQK
jgi:hypothetical protein